MSDIIKESKLIWHWSLKPGVFVNKITGRPISMTENVVEAPWAGTIEQWNASLVETAKFLAYDAFGLLNEKTVLHIPDTLYSKMTSNILEKWGGKINRNNDIPFNIVCIESDLGLAAIKVLNINDKGNII